MIIGPLPFSGYNIYKHPLCFTLSVFLHFPVVAPHLISEMFLICTLGNSGRLVRPGKQGDNT